MILKARRDEEFMIDDEDYTLVEGFNWFKEDGYIRRHRGKDEDWPHQRTHLSHVIMGLTLEQKNKGFVVDHINFNRADNRKSNLRIITGKENSQHINPLTLPKRREAAACATAIAAKQPRTEVQIKHSRSVAKKINELGANRHEGKDNYQSKEILDLDTGIIFECVRHAAEFKGLVYSTAKNRLNGGLENHTSLRNLKDVI